MAGSCALVVGASGDGLHGVAHDARMMAALLEARGFTVDLRINATRASIIDGYQSLISSAVRDEAAIFYFAGHGFRGQLDDAPGAVWQGIVPVDFAENTTEDFRGITACELSILQKRLTGRTRNVTTILDCCFASQMSRVLSDAGTVRSLPHPARLGFAAHVHALRSRYGSIVDELDPLGNPDAVRVAACGPSECASEARWPDGSPGGAMTIALAGLLDEIGHMAVSWAVLGEALRHRVQRRWPTQRPTIEGPIRRELFSLHEVHSDAISATLTGDGAWLAAGRIAGVAVGDVYGVMPLSARSYRASAALARLEIRAVRPMSAEGVLKPPISIPCREVLAFVLEKAVEPRSVAISGTDEEAEVLALAIANAPGLLPVRADEPETLARVHVTASEISIADARGNVCTPFAFPSELGHAVAQLVQLAVAQNIRELEGANGILDTDVSMSWGTVENNELRSLPQHGCTLGLSARPYVRISNRSTRRLYAHVLGIGLRGEISVLTSVAPSGIELRADRPDFVLGQAPDGRLHGLNLSWPQGVSRDAGPKLDELIVIVAAVRGDLRTLSTASGARLGNVLERCRTKIYKSPMPEDGLWVGRISFALDPRATHIQRGTP